MKQTKSFAVGTLCTAIASCLLIPQVAAQGASEWADVKDPQELQSLYSDKTHRSRTAVWYYRADGTGLRQEQGSEIRIPRAWAVRGDRVCTGPRGEEPTCFHLQRNIKKPNEVLARGERRGQKLMLWFTVEDGIPKF